MMSTTFHCAAQQDDPFTDYQRITSPGELHEDFLVNPWDKIYSELESNLSKDRDSARVQQEFILNQNCDHKRVLSSGKISFGSALSLYIQKVGDRALEQFPAIEKGDIKFYLYNSPEINAFTTVSGIIVVCTGLFERLTCEADLAFLLCHEIVHFAESHHLHGLYDRRLELKNDTSTEFKSERLYRHSREHEFLADAKGLTVYAKLGYDKLAPERLLSLLYYNNLPVDQVPFDKAFFESEGISIPANRLLGEVSPIPEIVAEFDQIRTHPNIKRRIEQIQTESERLSFVPTGEPVVTQAKFKQMTELAKFEMLSLYIVFGRYSKALYHGFLLSESYPDNQYVDLQTAKAFYGLSKNKTQNNLSRVAEGYTRVHGESQRLHHLIKFLTRKQFNVLAIKKMATYIAKYPEEELLTGFYEDLIRDLVVYNKMKLSDFNASVETYEDPKMERKKFHLNGFVSELESTEFQSYFEMYAEDLKIVKEYNNLSVLDSRKRYRAYFKTDFPMSDKHVLVLGPQVITKSKLVISHERTAKMRADIDLCVQDQVVKHGMLPALLSMDDVKNAGQYQALVSSVELFEEALLYGGVTKLAVMDKPSGNVEFLYCLQIVLDYDTKQIHCNSVFVHIESGRRYFIGKRTWYGYPTSKKVRAIIRSDWQPIY
jgi:hypothetical protein